MGTNKPLFFLCAKEHSARNLLLLLNTNRIVSDTYLTSSRSRGPRFHPGSQSESWMKTHLFSTYNRLSGTRGSIASVNYNRTRYMTSPLQLIEAGCFAYPAPPQRSVMGEIGGS